MHEETKDKFIQLQHETRDIVMNLEDRIQTLDHSRAESRSNEGALDQVSTC